METERKVGPIGKPGRQTGLRQKRLIEVYSAGCTTCNEAVKLVQELACRSCEVIVHDMQNREVIELVQDFDIRSVPAVVITTSRLAPCCVGGRSMPSADVLRQAGVGQPFKSARKRQIEIFTAGCLGCNEAVKLVQELACLSCEITVHDMRDEEVAIRAKNLNIRSIPAIVITAPELAACCTQRGPDAAVLREAGVGQPIELITR